MATTKIGQVSILPCGAFSLGTHYERLSVVTYNGSSYIAKVENTNKPITDTTVWYLLASKGDKGDTYEVTPEDLQAIADQITSDASSAFNTHVTEKTTEFDNHVTSKTGDFDTNASNKTTTFNNNATSKTGDFNTNASNKTTDFNTNASNKTTAYDNNASAKVDYYNQNAEATIEGNVMNLDQIPKKLVEGTIINVTDSSNLPLADIQIKGNASQTTTSIAGGDEYDSPTPDHPQPISVVTGDNTVKVIGKNLFNGNDTYIVQSNKISATFLNEILKVVSTNTSANLRMGYIIPVDVGKQVTISYQNLDIITGSAGYVRYNEFDEIPTTIDNTNEGTDIPTTNKTVTITTTKKYLAVILRTGNGATFDVEGLQVEYNSIATAYEPYTEQTQLISLGNIELAKIGDYEDYIYKSEGKWYKYGAIGKAVLDGTENWSVSDSGTANWSYRCPATGRTRESGTCISNYYPYAGVSISASNTVQGITRTNVTSTTSQIRIRYGTEDTIDNYKLWLTTHNLVTYAILETPEITEITDTTLKGQLDNLLAMKTKRTITNMFTVTDNETPTLAVLYRQDLTTLFNNLSNAILSLGNNT